MFKSISLGRTRWLILGLLGFCVIGVWILLVLVGVSQLTSSAGLFRTTRTAENSLDTMPSPLEQVQFPIQNTDYPKDWPAELRYPEKFMLVDSGATLLSGGTAPFWTSKLLYKGDVKSAADLLSSFFMDKGWTMTQRYELNSGGVVLIIEKNNRKNTGDIVIDLDLENSGYVKIVAVVALG